MEIWKALNSLNSAGSGDIHDGKWVPHNPTNHYTLYVPDRKGLSGDEPWSAGKSHLEVHLGEMVLTFEQPRQLTYYDGETQVKVWL